MTPIVRCAAWVMLATSAAVLAAGCSKEMTPSEGMIRAACAGDAAAIERLVNSGIPVDVTDDQNNTALIWAVHCCKVNVVQKLIELGADVNHVNERGFTPLIYTATPLRGQNLRGTQAERNEIARLLIEHGADVNRVVEGGNTALHFAVDDKNLGLVQMLLVAGADRHAKTRQGHTPLDVAKFPVLAPNSQVIKALEEAEARPSTDP
jgi:ankyrin repeat protein